MSSLVAYGASDDSATDEDSDLEENIGNNKKETKTVDGDNKDAKTKDGAAKNQDQDDNVTSNDIDDQISDEEEYQQTAPSSSLLLTTGKSFDLSTSDAFQVSTNWDLPAVSSQSQGLPAPQQREKMEVEETELEDEVRQKPTEIAEAPKPPPKRTKQPVKIVIPSLSDIPDDDEDVEKISVQKTGHSKVRSGLFSILPPPIHSAKKEINRPLIPHSLGKKTTTPKASPITKPNPPTQSSNKTSVISSSIDSTISKPNILNNLSGYDDSDDDNDDANDNKESNNFFSLRGKGSNNTKLNKPLTSSSISSSSDIISESKKVISDSTKEDKTAQDSEISSTEKTEEKEETEIRPEPGLVNDSPLDFGNSSRFASWSSASSSYLGGVKSNHPYHPANAYNTAASSVQYNMVDADGVDQTDKFMPTDTGGDAFQQMMNDKEFQKFQGKRKRGEEINFVDANVDDYVDPSELSKHVSEEMEYTSAKSKDDMPTSQQRRKKQITYLAFQAKEKELELKNTWSQNKLTRRQTQAKYGF